MENKDIIILILILGLAISLGYIFSVEPKIVYQDKLIEDNRAILNVEIFGWYENINNNNEMFFDYWLYNYGNLEAKNVKVKCKLFDMDNNLISSVLDNVGNLASKSAYFGEGITENIETGDEEYYYFCYVESCDNCKILYKEIPELVENFERE